MSELQIKYDKLLLDYETLENEYKDLQSDYSENTIIQSMNDMKDVYNHQKKKIEKLNDIIDSILEVNKSVKLMLSVLCKNVNNIEDKYLLKYRIEFIQEILESSLKLKSGVYY